MKKFLSIIILLIISVSVLFAADDTTPTGMKESVRLSVTTTNTVYLGVSSQKVVSSIFPSSSIINEEKFYYDPKAMLWYSPSLFFFVISFVKDKLKVTLKTPSGLENETNNTLNWTNVSSVSINPNSTVSLVTESLNSTSPRVYSWEMKLVVDGGSEIAPGKYSGEFVLKVEVV